VKIFSLERTLGIDDVHWSLLGASGTLSFTAGVIYWPLVFILTDIINEYFGLRGVRLVSWLAVAFISWAFLCAYIAISLAPAPFWVDSNAALGVPDIQKAFALIFGQGMWTIVGSIVAFLVGQLIDVTVFQKIRALTGERWMWLRATGSTAVSQLLRQLHRAVHRLRARSAALAGVAVPGRGHRELPVQDARRNLNDSFALSGSCRCAPVSWRRGNREIAARSGRW
jgi:uncharacterized integral membrane protein (TIGR00697 family)